MDITPIKICTQKKKPKEIKKNILDIHGKGPRGLIFVTHPGAPSA